MTTITIKNELQKLSKTSFENTKDLFIFLRKELCPLQFFAIDSDQISPTSLEKIKKSANNSQKKLTNFQ